jgi:hypothetical protein
LKRIGGYFPEPSGQKRETSGSFPENADCLPGGSGFFQSMFLLFSRTFRLKAGRFWKKAGASPKSREISRKKPRRVWRKSSAFR